MLYNYVMLVGTFQKVEVLENSEILTLEDEDESGNISSIPIHINGIHEELNNIEIGKIIIVRAIVKMNEGQLQLIANKIIVPSHDGNKELL